VEDTAGFRLFAKGADVKNLKATRTCALTGDSITANQLPRAPGDAKPVTASQRRPGSLGQRRRGRRRSGWAALAILALVPALTLTCAVPALTTAALAATPPTPTLAALTAQAAAVQAELSAGAKTLESAAATATAQAATLNTQLAGLRDQLAEYAAQLYVDPTAQESIAALAQGSDLAVTVQGVQMLTIVNRGRAEVLRAAVYDEQQAEELNAQAAQAVAAAAVVQAQVSTQVAALQLKSSQAQAKLTAAQTAYQTAQEKAALQRIAAATAAHNSAARAAAVKEANALAADTAGAPGGTALCNAAAAGPYPSGPWGGYADGFIPSSQLCSITGGGRLRPDAAAAFDKMSQAYKQAFGTNICVTDSYRSYTEQVRVFRQRPSLAAVPGTSNHGWGLALDLGCGIQSSRSSQYRWMVANAGRFGWVHPSWAVHDPFEPWHWEFGHLPGAGGT
jgi:D-alanyl-D-alanine carboxypeptidase